MYNNQSAVVLEISFFYEYLSTYKRQKLGIQKALKQFRVISSVIG